MNGVDIAILVALAVFSLKGLLRGLIKELCSLIGIVAGAFLAFRLHPPLADWFLEALGVPGRVGVIAAFLIIFLAVVSLCTAFGYLLSGSISVALLGGVNQVAGGCFGLLQGVVLLAVVLFALSLRPTPDVMRQWLVDSQLAPPFVDLGEKVFSRTRQSLPLGN